MRWTTAMMIASACLATLSLAEGKAHAVEAPAADPVPALLASPADLARGKALFTGTCGAYCHKPTPGPGDAPFLFDCDWLHGGSDQEIFHTISKGVPGTRMVPFGGALQDTDIWRLVAYLRSASQCRDGARPSLPTHPSS
jgi:cytochrome c oxidase cbb3-type subunit 3